VNINQPTKPQPTYQEADLGSVLRHHDYYRIFEIERLMPVKGNHLFTILKTPPELYIWIVFFSH
jgi:hypothetical protein